ncbi:unnamed protein product [Cylicocyclus nassatus]|uniref:Uncharacterized protein n=1 Tax=Cylicocyclus nassatus TaxID=53992 RepID=A0AA36GQX5_CYLNA|nr:unnamed protein product [Cylicocyclus nassatus]
MFSYVPVVLLVAIIARTQALECYYGITSYSMTRQKCAPTVKYCYTMKPDYDKNIYLGCDGFNLCKGKGGCSRNGNLSICCCASNLCNA